MTAHILAQVSKPEHNYHLYDLTVKLEAVIIELESVLNDIGETESASTQARIEGFFNSMARTVAEREKDASRNAQTYDVDLPKLRAARESLLLRKNLLELRINLSQQTNACL